MNRDAAIEAVRKTLREAPWRRRSRRLAEDIIYAAAPHLAPEPVGYVVVSEFGHVSTGLNIYTTVTEARRVCDFLANDPDVSGDYRVVALVPVEDQP